MLKKQFILLLFLLLLCSCSKKTDSPAEPKPQAESSIAESIDAVEENEDEKGIVYGGYYTLYTPSDDKSPRITWAIEKYSEMSFVMSREMLDAVNEIIHNNGINASLEILVFEHPGYGSSIYNSDFTRIYSKWIDEYEKEFGPVDIISGGFGKTSQDVAQFLKSGMFLCLNEYLTTEEGRKLYEGFAENDWKLTSIDNKYYSIPMNTKYVVQSKTPSIGFNKNYIGDISEFDGSFESLLSLYDQSGSDKKIVLKDSTSIEYMLGYELWEGICFDEQNRKFHDIYSDENLIMIIDEYQDMLSANSKDRFLYFDDNNKYSDEDVFARFCYSEESKSDNYIYYDYDERTIRQKYNATNGVRSTSENIELSLKILNLVYSEVGIADILNYGLQDHEDASYGIAMTNMMDFGCYYFSECEKAKKYKEKRDEYLGYYNTIKDSILIGLDVELSDEDVYLLGCYRESIYPLLLNKEYQLENNMLGLETSEDFSAAIAPIIDKLNKALGD
ncbi:MAG: hypothetical protein IKR27_07175 [Lachnospiraceae bacterium]|nr:hypothetical protein [Lachnospiraceae bacterium]MBR6274767.1 hypothetical protein [Lachnospiraceae bacterium]